MAGSSHRTTSTPLPIDAVLRRTIPRQLLNWYDRHKRDLPWRHRQHDAYAQMLAELMLQQTQVATVIGYYQRFIERFPTVHSLAAADLDEVLTLWSGLGYYRRARHLHAAARKIVDSFGGIVPSTVEALMTLPGIGRYTAGAIASVAYGVRAPVLDGNVRRVLSRLFAVREAPRSPQIERRLWSLAESILPQKRCGDFNQALMELGATICSPQSPECLHCPLRRHCRACEQGLTDRIPPPTPRTKVRDARIIVAAIRAGRAMLFVRRPQDGLWAGLWELPSEPLTNGESRAAGLERLRRRLPASITVLDKLVGQVTRLLTHRRVTFHLYAGRSNSTDGLDERLGQPTRWVTADELPQLGLSRACQATLQRIGWPD